MYRMKHYTDIKKTWVLVPILPLQNSKFEQVRLSPAHNLEFVKLYRFHKKHVNYFYDWFSLENIQRKVTVNVFVNIS